MSPKGFKIGSRSVPQCKPCNVPNRKNNYQKLRFYILTQASLISISQVRRNKDRPRGYGTSSTPMQTVTTPRSFIISLTVRVWLVNLVKKACVASHSGPPVLFKPSPLPNMVVMQDDGPSRLSSWRNDSTGRNQGNAGMA